MKHKDFAVSMVRSVTRRTTDENVIILLINRKNVLKCVPTLTYDIPEAH